MPLVLWYGGRFRKPSTHQKCSYFVLPEGLGSQWWPTKRLLGPGDWLRYTSIIFDPEPPGPCKIRCAFSRYISWSWTRKWRRKTPVGSSAFMHRTQWCVGLFYSNQLIYKHTKTKQRTPPKFQWLFRGLHEVTSFSLAVLFLHFRPWFSTYSCTFTERSARRWRSEGFGTWRAMPSQTPK